MIFNFPFIYLEKEDSLESMPLGRTHPRGLQSNKELL